MLIEFSPPMTTLAMFSGGLDSTAMLVQLLTRSQDELRVHHIRMANREERADAEQAAVERIVGWCASRYRGFRYSESALDFRALEAIPIDYLCIAFVACQVAIDTPRCNRIAVGALARDTDIENRSVLRLLSRAQAGRAAGRLGLPGLPREQDGAGGLAAARALGNDLVVPPARAGGARLSPLRVLQGLSCPGRDLSRELSRPGEG